MERLNKGLRCGGMMPQQEELNKDSRQLQNLFTLSAIL